MRLSLFVGLILLAAALCPAQTQTEDHGIKIVFHVTSVSQKPDLERCGPEDHCIATLFTVEGYATVNRNVHRTKYVLNCDEILSNDNGSLIVTCPRVHATANYDALLYGATIFFGSSPTESNGALVTGYTIVSEKEADN